MVNIGVLTLCYIHLMSQIGKPLKTVHERHKNAQLPGRNKIFFQ